MYALQLGSSSILPMTLKNRIELGILETLVAAGGKWLTPTEVAAKLPCAANPEALDMVDRMLRLLASYNVVSCLVEEGTDGRLSRRYGAAPVCKFLTPNEDGVSMAALALMNQDKVLMESWRVSGVSYCRSFLFVPCPFPVAGVWVHTYIIADFNRTI
ncbi:hypothetical protein ACQ4PT_021684 [Festuca glaucescens]